VSSPVDGYRFEPNAEETMVDPVVNEGMSKLAEQAGETAAESGAEEADEASFSEVLDEKMESDQVDGPREAELERTEEASRVEGVDDLEAATGSEEMSRAKLGEFVEGISQNRDEMEQMLERSMNGETLDQKELLEMQALIYGYSQKVKLASKVVEKGTGGLKQMMQMRV
jgi:hypothetical protein